MTAVMTRPSPSRLAPRRPSLRPGHTLRAGMMRIRAEVTQYFRRPDSVLFTFLFPTLMLLVFANAFSGLDDFVPAIGDSPAITQAMYYLPAMLTSGLLLTGVQNLGIEIATERSNGTLKRFAGTPLPVASYFMGKLGQMVVTSVGQAGLLLLVGRFGFGIELPTDPGAWLAFGGVFLGGLTTFALLGIVVGQLPRSETSASAVIIPIVLAVQFVSGIFIAFTLLPAWLQSVANALPVAWVGHVMRAVFLPESGRYLEAGEAYDLPRAAAVIGAWALGAFVLALVTFRWTRKDT